MDREKINKIIESPESVLKQPKMYFGKDNNADIAGSYLYGIRHGVLTFLN